jgi:hypothetical protein
VARSCCQEVAHEACLLRRGPAEVAPGVQPPAVHGRQQRRVPALGDEPAGTRPPQREVLGDRHLDERHRQAGRGVACRAQIPLGHSDVVLLGAERDLLAGDNRTEAVVSPGPGELPA